MNPFRRALSTLALASFLLAPLTLAAEPPTFAFEATAEALNGPQTLPAGLVTLTFTNSDAAPHMLMLARLNDGVTLDALQGKPDAVFEQATLAGGFGPTMPGQEAVITFDLAQPGNYVALDMMSGNSLPLTVEAQGTQLERPAADVVVNMLDFGYDLPTEVAAGEQLWEVVNAGAEPHEMILFKLQPGVSMEDLMTAMETNPEGEPPAEMVGGAMPMGVGYANFIALTLEPGDYVAWCFIPSPAHDPPRTSRSAWRSPLGWWRAPRRTSRAFAYSRPTKTSRGAVFQPRNRVAQPNFSFINFAALPNSSLAGLPLG